MVVWAWEGARVRGGVGRGSVSDIVLCVQPTNSHAHAHAHSPQPTAAGRSVGRSVGQRRHLHDWSESAWVGVGVGVSGSGSEWQQLMSGWVRSLVRWFVRWFSGTVSQSVPQSVTLSVSQSVPQSVSQSVSQLAGRTCLLRWMTARTDDEWTVQLFSVGFRIACLILA